MILALPTDFTIMLPQLTIMNGCFIYLFFCAEVSQANRLERLRKVEKKKKGKLEPNFLNVKLFLLYLTDLLTAC